MAIWGAALAGSPEVSAAEETPSVQHGVTSRTSWAKFAARVTEGVRSVYGLTLTGATSCPRVLRVTGPWWKQTVAPRGVRRRLLPRGWASLKTNRRGKGGGGEAVVVVVVIIIIIIISATTATTLHAGSLF